MGEDLQQRFVKYLDHVEKAAGKVGEFAETEIPLTIQEWLRWNFYESLLYVILFSILGLVGAYIGRKVYINLFTLIKLINEQRRESPNDEDVVIGFNIAGAILSLGLIAISIPNCFWNIRDCIKISTAPRVVVIEKIAELTKGKK